MAGGGGACKSGGSSPELWKRVEEQGLLSPKEVLMNGRGRKEVAFSRIFGSDPPQFWLAPTRHLSSLIFPSARVFLLCSYCKT